MTNDEIKEIIACRLDVFYEWAYEVLGGEFEQDRWDGSWNEVGTVKWDDVVKGVDEWMESD